MSSRHRTSYAPTSACNPSDKFATNPGVTWRRPSLASELGALQETRAASQPESRARIASCARIHLAALDATYGSRATDGRPLPAFAFGLASRRAYAAPCPPRFNGAPASLTLESACIR